MQRTSWGQAPRANLHIDITWCPNSSQHPSSPILGSHVANARANNAIYVEHQRKEKSPTALGIPSDALEESPSDEKQASGDEDEGHSPTTDGAGVMGRV